MILARDNPFATDRVEKLLVFRPDWAGTTWDALDRRWEDLARRATLVGHHGSGKTTFLDAWKKRLGKNHHETIHLLLNQENKTLTKENWKTIKNCSGKIILLDGEEQLNYWARKKFYQLSQNADGLLVTRHSIGKLPVLFHFDPKIDSLERCVRKLAPDYYDQISPKLERWWQLSNGNIRDTLLLCYDEVNRINK